MINRPAMFFHVFPFWFLGNITKPPKPNEPSSPVVHILGPSAAAWWAPMLFTMAGVKFMEVLVVFDLETFWRFRAFVTRAFLTFGGFGQEDATRFLENLKLIKVAGSFGDCCTIIDMSGASGVFRVATANNGWMLRPEPESLYNLRPHFFKAEEVKVDQNFGYGARRCFFVFSIFLVLFAASRGPKKISFEMDQSDAQPSGGSNLIPI